MKRTLSFILAMLMVVTIFATVGMADGETEPTGEPEAVETAAPAAVEPAPAAEEPAPATEEPAPATEEPIAPIAEQPADNGGVAPASEVPAPVSDPEPTEAGPAMRYIVLDCKKGTFQGYSLFSFTVVEGQEVKGLDWYAPECPGYKFTGWFDEKSGTQYKDGDTIPEGVDELDAHWTRVVVLDATPGNFWDPAKGQEDNNYTRTVELTEGNKFPGCNETPLFDISKTEEEQTVVFDGWYTGPCTVSEEQSGDHRTMTIKTSGQKVNDNESVEEGVTTLYAGYKLKDTAKPVDTITYYYDWNGIDGMYGHCLTSSRSYSSDVKGYKLTPEDLLIRYLNWSGEDEGTALTFKPESQKDLDDYWAARQFNGYKFKGWATTEKATDPNVKAGDTVVKNGDTLYAVWTKDGTSNVEFDREPKDVGPITGIRFETGVSSSQNVHAGTTVNLPLDVAPAKGTGEIVWTVQVYNSSAIVDVLKGKHAQFTIGPNGEETFDGIYDKNGDTGETAKLADYGITAEPAGRSLNISTDQQLTVTVSAAVKDHPEICTNYSINISFAHNPGVWQQNIAPTCSKRGQETTECTVCHAPLYRDIVPLEHVWGTKVTKEATCTTAGEEEKACTRCGHTYNEIMSAQNVYTTIKPTIIAPTGHTYEVEKTGMENGVPIYTETCIHHDSTLTVKGGDTNGDGILNTRDVRLLFQVAAGVEGKSVDEVAGDVTGDGVVNTRDVRAVFQYVAGVKDTLG